METMTETQLETLRYVANAALFWAGECGLTHLREKALEARALLGSLDPETVVVSDNGNMASVEIGAACPIDLTTPKPQLDFVMMDVNVGCDT
jgi:hypothetical protein